MPVFTSSMKSTTAKIISIIKVDEKKRRYNTVVKTWKTKFYIYRS